MGTITSLASRRPHIVVHTPDGDELRAPVELLVRYINGEAPLGAIAGERSEELVRLLLGDYLSLFGEAW